MGAAFEKGHKRVLATKKKSTVHIHDTGRYKDTSKNVQRVCLAKVADKHVCGNLAVLLFLLNCSDTVARFLIAVAFVCSQLLGGGLASRIVAVWGVYDAVLARTASPGSGKKWTILCDSLFYHQTHVNFRRNVIS